MWERRNLGDGAGQREMEGEVKLQEVGFQTRRTGEGERSMGVRKFGKRKGGTRLREGRFIERKRAGDAAVAGRVAGGEVRDLRMEKGEERGG